MDTVFQTLLAVLSPTCMVAPPGDDAQLNRVVPRAGAFAGHLEVDVGVAILAADGAGARVVVGDAFLAVVEVRRLNRAGKQHRRPRNGDSQPPVLGIETAAARRGSALATTTGLDGAQDAIAGRPRSCRVMPGPS